MSRSNKEKFIEKARKIHGDRYDYSKVEYVNSSTKVCIVCPEHGEFWQTPNNHSRGTKCPKCVGLYRMTTEEFIFKAKQIHGDKYDYSKVEYKNNHTKVCIICPEHGEFWQEPQNHLRNSGCPKCSTDNGIKLRTLTTEEFVRRAKEIHGNKYDYSKVSYIDSHNKVCIICPEHGEFWQTPNTHLEGSGCPKCVQIHQYTTSEWVEMAHEVHGNKYDYSKTKYIDAKTKVCIICHEKDKYGNEHGEFWVYPGNHIYRKNNCPKCRRYRLEDEIRNFLIASGIEYEEQKSFEWLRGERGKKRLDFYLPKYLAAIECQGIQHFEPTDFANKGQEWAINKYNNTIKCDKYKEDECKKHGIVIFYYSNLGIHYPYKVFEDKNKLLENIKRNGNKYLFS